MCEASRNPIHARLSPDIRTLVRNGLAAAGLASTLWASPASAQDAQLWWDVGTYVGYTWGPGGGVTWGFEGRVGADFRDQFACGTEPSFMTGGVGRFSFVDLRPQIHLGGQAGVGMGMFSAMGDVTLGYRWGDDGGFSLPLGMELEVFMGTTFLRGDPVLGEISTGGGLALPPRELAFGCAIAGRALHDDAGHAALPAITPLGERLAPRGLSRELAQALSFEWEQRAAAEWASVPAFLQLADQLTHAGAPAALTRRALVAADDELRHAEASARAAVHYGGAPLRLGRVTPHTRAPARGADALVRLACESWVDGCLGEGRSARAAASEAERASSRAPRELQATIAREESQHESLAWDVMAWSLAAGGEEVREALSAVREAMPSEASGASSDVDLARFGILSESTHGEIADAHRQRALPRLDAMLSSRGSASS